MPAKPTQPPAPHLDARLTHVLEAPPPISIPSNFAARVAAEALTRFGPLPQPARQPTIQPAPSFGLIFLRVAVVALLVAMLLLARQATTAAPTTLLVYATLCAEFIGLTLYLGLQTRRPY